jgi:hypothetical protein
MRLDASRVAAGAVSKNMLAIRRALDEAQWALNPESKSLPSAVDSPMATILTAARSILYEYKGLVADPELRSRIEKFVDMVTEWYENAEESSLELNQRRINSIDSYMEYVSRSIDAHRHDDPLPDQAVQVGSPRLAPAQVMFARGAPHLTPQASRSTHASRASLPGRPGPTATM